MIYNIVFFLHFFAFLFTKSTLLILIQYLFFTATPISKPSKHMNDKFDRKNILMRSSRLEKLLLELPKSLQVHDHRSPVDSLGSEAVGNGLHLHVILNDHPKDGQVVPSFPGGHYLLHRGKPDIIFIVDRIWLQPSVKLLRISLEVIGRDRPFDKAVIHAYFYNVFKKNSQEVR